MNVQYLAKELEALSQALDMTIESRDYSFLENLNDDLYDLFREVQALADAEDEFQDSQESLDSLESDAMTHKYLK